MESTPTYDSSYSSKENYTKRIDMNYILYIVIYFNLIK